MLIRSMMVFTALGLMATGLRAQDPDSTARRKVWEVNGYVKDMQTLTFDKNFENLVTSNLIHNRVNVRWKPSSRITGGIEFRNRLFWGEEVRMTPNFADRLQNNNEAVNVSIIWFQTESMVLQTNIDRFWLEYHADKWDTRIGRQRLNWGISTVWNPNDIFNTYNFLDFDYEERPGRDAVKFLYHINDMSNIEVAAAAAEKSYHSVAAVKYFTNKWNYDWQFTGGVFHQKFTMGMGWSGSIKEAGFKGEIQYFAPYKDTVAQVNVSMEADYVLKKGWYVNAGFLINSSGLSQPVDNWSLVTFRFTPQTLMPTKWNTVVTVGKKFTPLLSANLSVIYAPGTNLMILLPSLKYNLASNLDVDLIWQSFFAEQGGAFDGVTHRAFLRIKWNF